MAFRLALAEDLGANIEDFNGVLAHINDEVKARCRSASPLEKMSVRLDQFALRNMRGLSDKFRV
jgi:hypothetical protein